MKRYLFCEYKKTRRKYIFVMAVAITAVALCWGLYGKYNESALKSGWMMMLYQLPLLNTIFMPLLAIVVASRFAGIETSMMKQLCSFMPKQRLYDAKLIYSLSIIIVSLLIQFAAVYIAGRCFGFSGRFPIELYALYFMFTIVPAVEIYVFQFSVSMLFKNQAVPFFIGAIGEFIGLFALFLPQYPWIRNSVIWGHYGALQFVGGDWDKVTRISTFYLMDINWVMFAVSILLCVAFYFIGRTLFVRKEV